MYRALLEGIAFGTNHVVRTYQELGHKPAQLLGVGGGTKNRVWLQATSDICGLDQKICKNTTGASYGDAFLAAMAIGAANAEDIARWNPVQTMVKARPNAIYEKQYQLFRNLYEQTSDIMAELGRNS